MPNLLVRSATIAVTVVMTTAFCACGLSHRSPTPESVAIVTTATAAEPRPVLPDSVRADLLTLAEHSKQFDGATVRLITSAKGDVPARDLTPLRSNGQVQHAPNDAARQINAAVQDFGDLVASTTADTRGLNLLPLLDRASTFPASRIDVLSSGVSTENPIDLRQLGWDFDPATVVTSVQRQGLLPDLSGHHVTFYGLGVVAGSQPTLPPFARRKIQQLWIALCTRANALGCSLGHGDEVTAAPVAGLPVPVVPVPDAITEGGCPVWSRLNDDTLHFQANSARLGAEADSALRPVVEVLQRCDLGVDVTGYMADTGAGGGAGGDDLSAARANAVADRLVALGLPADRLGAVVGRGAADPVVINFTDGQFDEGKARLNRRVELTFHHVSDR